MKKYYYLYKITNQLDGKIYIGVHQTYNLEDGYMGSGTLLKRAQKKHGIENFTKEILQQFEDEKEMYQEEAILVDREFVVREDTYNVAEGGNGKWPLNASSKGGAEAFKLKLGVHSEKARLESFARIKNNKKIKKWLISEENLKNLLKMRKIAYSVDFINKKKETFKKIKHQQGSSNSQYGTMWITNDKENKKIKNDDMIPSGWVKGRKLKHI